MEMTGTDRIGANRDTVWHALNDVGTLRVCMPGCEEIEQTSATVMTAIALQKIGPAKARFEGAVELLKINAPSSYTISGQGQGGVAGFAKGAADVTLEEDGNETILTYQARAQVGGKLASLGSRLIDATAKKVATEFFDNFHETISSGPLDD